MSEDATSQPSDAGEMSSATEDEQAQQLLAEAATHDQQDPAQPAANPGQDGPEQPDGQDQQDKNDDKLGDGGRRALASERQARRAAEKELRDLRSRVQQFEDAQKSDLQRAQEAAARYEQELTASRTANARLMAAAIHNLPPDLIDFLGDGTEDEIEARAKVLAERLAAAAPAAAPAPEPRPAPRRPVEALTPGARPASEAPTDPNEAFRQFLNSARR